MLLVIKFQCSKVACGNIVFVFCNPQAGMLQ